MEVDENIDNLFNLSGEPLFDELEKILKIKIPEVLRNILELNDVNTAGVISRLDENYICKIESFLRNNFNADMVPAGKQKVDFLGQKFEKNQKHFEFSVGQRIVLEAMDKFFSEKNSQVQRKSSEIILDDISVEHEIDLPKYIGSLILTVYNDAKRKTSSAHSWPSRHVASEMENHYKTEGNLKNFNPNLENIAPAQHDEFMDCIVQADSKNLPHLLKNSLAVSLRVDGSVDPTQDHNVYVLANVVHKDATMSTVFIGFGIPEAVEKKSNIADKSAASLSYFNCVKKIANDVLPWEEFLDLISSVVTDGESLNMGKDNGFCTRLQREGQYGNKEIIKIWCVPHRFNLAWKDLCKEIPLVDTIIDEAASLSSYFHKSGQRTHKLDNTARKNKLAEPLRYLQYFEVRWTQFTFDLLNVTLRNWRPAMQYFLDEQETRLSKRWLSYDRIRLLSFLADVLCLLKTFQKTFEDDTISILSLQDKKQTLLEALLECINKPTAEGWEEELLKNIEPKTDGKYLFGHKLVENVGRSNKNNTIYSDTNRELIIRVLIKHVNERMDFDMELQENLKPLAAISKTFSHQELKSCYAVIVPDLNEDSFYNEYAVAANVLKEFDSPLKTLQELQRLRPDDLLVLKSALARVAAAKPHSADVERLISVYNLFKATDRTSMGPQTLFNFLYVNMNMVPLFEYDPSDAVDFWMKKKNRRPHIGQKNRQQEWFNGVFAEAKLKDKNIPKINRIVKF